MRTYVIALLCLAVTRAAIPRVYTKCRLWDSGCLVRQAQLKVPAITAGIPELFTESLDPMVIDHASINQGGLRIEFNNAVIRGFRNAIIDRLSIDTISRQIRLVLHTDLYMTGQYNGEGRILGFPFNGDGNTQIIAKNLQLDFLMPFDITKDALGRDVIDLKGFQYWFDVKDNLRFDYSNLFYGNRGFSDTLHVFLNNNWKSISVAYGRPVLDVINKKIFNSIRSYMLSQPIEDLFLL